MTVLLGGLVFMLLGLASLAWWRRLSVVNLLLFVVGAQTGGASTALAIAGWARAHPITAEPPSGALTLTWACFFAVVMVSAELAGLATVWLKCRLLPVNDADELTGTGLSPGGR